MGLTTDQQAIANGSLVLRDCQARAVRNGHVIQGQTRYLDTDTLAVKMQTNDETVATTTTEAAAIVSSYLTTGEFPAVQIN